MTHKVRAVGRHSHLDTEWLVGEMDMGVKPVLTSVMAPPTTAAATFITHNSSVSTRVGIF